MRNFVQRLPHIVDLFNKHQRCIPFHSKPSVKLFLHFQQTIDRQHFSNMVNETLDRVPDVEIDETGNFKYILIRVRDGKDSKMVVRGNIRGIYHADILEEFESRVSSLKLKCECVGGGRIERDPEKKFIRVFSYSQGFGRADHRITVDILKKVFPDYNITRSDEDN